MGSDVAVCADVHTVTAAIVTHPQPVVSNYAIPMKGRGRLPAQLSSGVGGDDE